MHMQMESNGCIYLPFWIYYMQIVYSNWSQPSESNHMPTRILGKSVSTLS